LADVAVRRGTSRAAAAVLARIFHRDGRRYLQSLVKYPGLIVPDAHTRGWVVTVAGRSFLYLLLGGAAANVVNGCRRAHRARIMDQPETLQKLIHGLSRHGERAAIVAFGKERVKAWSYARLADHVARLAAGLMAHGLQRGEPVVLFAGNSPRWIIACLAVMGAGAVAVPVDAQMSRDELRHVLRDSGARRAFTTGELAQRLRDAGLRAIPGDAEAGADGWRAYLAEGGVEPPAVAPEENAALFYTSGTTGPPKGVPLTHRNLFSNLRALLDQNLAHQDDRLLLPLPLHHVYPFAIGMFAPLAL